MPSFARPIAVCVVNFLMAQASKYLQKLKEKVLALIDLIDAYILVLRAYAAQGDILAKLIEDGWTPTREFLDKLKQQLSGMPAASVVCPELTAYFSDPAVGILEQQTANLYVLKETMQNMLSYMDELDQLIAYWDNTKADLVNLIDLIDDAIYAALIREAGNIP